jgi:hypothetical protein
MRKSTKDRIAYAEKVLLETFTASHDFYPMYLAILTILLSAVLLDHRSSIYCVRPRPPASLAARISYIHSSESLIRDVELGAGLRGENDKPLLCGFGWYQTASEMNQIKFDAADGCTKVYYCVDGPPLGHARTRSDSRTFSISR